VTAADSHRTPAVLPNFFLVVVVLCDLTHNLAALEA